MHPTSSSSSPLLRGRYLLLALLVVAVFGYLVLFQKEVQDCSVQKGSESEKETEAKNESRFGSEKEGIGEKGEKGGKGERKCETVSEGGNEKEVGGKDEGKEKGEKEKGMHEFSGLSQLHRSSPSFSPFDPTVCIIARTYSGQSTILPAFIASVASSNYPNVQIFLVDTQDDFQDMARFAELFNSLYNKKFVHVSNITRKEARGMFPQWQVPFDFGYIQTDLLMRQLSKASKCDYFLVTNGDNLYARDFFKYTIAPLRKKIDLIAVEFVSHYCYEKSVPWRPKPGCYSQVYSEIKMSRIDLGAAMFRKDKIVELEASFILYYLESDPAGNGLQADFCDGYFFEFLKKHGASTEIVPAALFVHQ